VLETLASPAPFWQQASNVVHITSWGSSTTTIGVLIEQANGTKWLGGTQGAGAVFAIYDAGAYQDLARHSAGNVTNKLFKRLRTLPSGIRESDLFCFPVGFGATQLSALWVDYRTGIPYFSGRTGNQFGMRYDAGANERWAYAGFITKVLGA
jgi:hypothetical protein